MMVATLSLLGLLVALYLTLFKIGVIGELTCRIGSCETVNTSRWSMFLGLPVAAWGMAAYLVLLMLSLIGLQPRFDGSRPVAVALTGIAGAGTLFSAWLTYLELAVIHAICIWCVTSAVIIGTIFLVSVLDLRSVTAARPDADPELADASTSN